MLRTNVKYICSLLIIAAVVGYSVYKFNTLDSFEKDLSMTLDRGEEILNLIENFFNESHSYPDSLKDFLKQNDLVSSDAWGYDFFYYVTDDKQAFSLKSLGKDGVKGTSDDIVFKDCGCSE